MAIHGKNTGVVIAGVDPTRYFTDYTVSGSVDTAETTGFQMEAKEYTVGQSDGTVSFSGRYQGSKSNVEAAFERIQDNADGDPFLVAVHGWRVGSRCLSGLVERTGFDVTGGVGDVVGTSLNVQATGGIVRGWLLTRQDAAAGTVLTATVDTTESFPTGYSDAILQVHATANTLNQAATVRLQHSVDGTTWVDAPATDVTIPANTTTSARTRLGATGARYVRVSITVPAGATGSATITAAFGRI